MFVRTRGLVSETARMNERGLWAPALPSGSVRSAEVAYATRLSLPQGTPPTFTPPHHPPNPP